MARTLLAQADIGTFDCFGGFCPTTPSDSPTTLENLITAVFGFLTIAAGLAFLIYFMVGALQWVTAGGDASKVDGAKKYMTNGAIGMIIIAAAYSITWIVGKVLGLDILNPAAEIMQLFNPPAAPVI